VVDLRRCREILGSSCSLSDEQIEVLRDQLAALADVGLNGGLPELRNSSTSALDIAGSLEQQREEIEERASIMEFDGGMQRNQAETAALRSYGRIRRNLKLIN
jgi:hypothetical protein